MENCLTIGVIGHKGHGKSSLVRHVVGSLSGKEHLPAKNGKWAETTIETKFFPVVLPSGLRCCLVDVPGNPKYIKNLIRGLCQVDMAILVVAADDGVMPQTFEHLKILELFGVKYGLLVISKTDLVDEETVIMAATEAVELTDNTFLAGCPVCRFSEKIGSGNEDEIGDSKDVMNAIETQAPLVPTRSGGAPFRLAIDQVKRFPGFGTVVTGSVLSGSIKKNDPVKLLPDGGVTRARHLQTHGRDVNCVHAGSRVGINLHKVSFCSVKKGMVLAERDANMPARFFNAEIRIFNGGQRATVLHDRIRIRFFTGTSVTSAMLVKIEPEPLQACANALVQIRPVHPLAAFPGDRFVISPLNDHIIIGGGRILETTNRKYRKAFSRIALSRLQAMQRNDSAAYMDAMFDYHPYSTFSADEMVLGTLFQASDVAIKIQDQVDSGELIEFGQAGVLKKAHYEGLGNQVLSVCKKLSGNKTLKLNFHINEICREISKTAKSRVSNEVLQDSLDKLCHRGLVISANGLYQLPVNNAHLATSHQVTLSKLYEFTATSWPKPFTAGHFCKTHGGKFNKKTVEKLLRHLVSQNALIALDQDRFMEPAALVEVKRRIKDAIEQKGRFLITDCQEVLGYGRTQAISVLEYLDATGFTERDGNARILSGRSNEKTS